MATKKKRTAKASAQKASSISKKEISVAKSSILGRVLQEIELAKQGLVGLDSYYKDPSTAPGGVYGRSDNPVFGKSDPPSHSKSDSPLSVIDLVINPKETMTRPSINISRNVRKTAVKQRAVKRGKQ